MKVRHTEAMLQVGVMKTFCMFELRLSHLSVHNHIFRSVSLVCMEMSVYNVI